MGLQDRDWYQDEVRKKGNAGSDSPPVEPVFHGQYEPIQRRRFQGYFRGKPTRRPRRAPWLLLVGPWIILFLLAKLFLDLDNLMLRNRAHQGWSAAQGWIARLDRKPNTSPPVYTPDHRPSYPQSAYPDGSSAPFPSFEREKPNQRAYEFAINADRQGHYRFVGSINGQPVHFLIDTGATVVSVPEALGRQLNLAPMSTHLTTTASDSYTVAGTRIANLGIGPFRLSGIDADLNPRAQNQEILLGMSALRYFEMVQRNGTLSLRAYGEPPAGLASFSDSSAPPQPIAIKRPVRECMGADKRIDQRVLNCIQGN